MKKNDPFAKARAAAKHPKIHSQEWRDFQGVLDPDPNIEEFKAMLKRAQGTVASKKAPAVARRAVAAKKAN